MNESKTIVPQILIKTEHIVHHDGHYLRERTSNGVTVLMPHAIPMREAQAIIERGEADPHTTTSSRFGVVEFPGRSLWSWIATTTEEVIH